MSRIPLASAPFDSSNQKVEVSKAVQAGVTEPAACISTSNKTSVRSQPLKPSFFIKPQASTSAHHQLDTSHEVPGKGDSRQQVRHMQNDSHSC